MAGNQPTDREAGMERQRCAAIVRNHMESHRRLAATFHSNPMDGARHEQAAAALETVLERIEMSERPLPTILAAMAEHFERQRDWSLRTFGPGARTSGVLDHIRKELREIEAEPLSLEEWIDVAILAFDGAWRAGHSPEAIARAWLGKQAQNEARDWPDWRTMPADQAIEHVRAK